MNEAHRLTLAALLVLSIAWVPLGHAQSAGMDMKDMDMSKCRGMYMDTCMDMMGKDKKGQSADKRAQSDSHKGVGVVKNVDSAGGKVTIAHDPIKSLSWPAMTMSFVVKDKKLLEKMSPEKKVEFEFVQQGSDYVITSAK